MKCYITFKNIFEDLTKQPGHRISVYGERTDLENVLHVLGQEHVLIHVDMVEDKEKDNNG